MARLWLCGGAGSAGRARVSPARRAFVPRAGTPSSRPSREECERNKSRTPSAKRARGCLAARREQRSLVSRGGRPAAAIQVRSAVTGTGCEHRTHSGSAEEVWDERPEGRWRGHLRDVPRSPPCLSRQAFLVRTRFHLSQREVKSDLGTARGSFKGAVAG